MRHRRDRYEPPRHRRGRLGQRGLGRILLGLAAVAAIGGVLTALPPAASRQVIGMPRPAAPIAGSGSVGADAVPEGIGDAESPPSSTVAPATTTQPETTQPTEPPAAPPDQPPGTLRLPRGGTSTMVRSELGPDHELPVPTRINDASWWGAGLDAKTGASVFAGHINWHGSTGPFAELWQTQPGEIITAVDDAGHLWRFRVTDVFSVLKSELPGRAQELFGQRGPHRLVLVTCGGRWVGGSTGYAENRVVIAHPEG